MKKEKKIFPSSYGALEKGKNFFGEGKIFYRKRKNNDTFHIAQKKETE